METTSTRRMRKQSPDKTAFAADMFNDSSRRINGKARRLPLESVVKPERARKNLNEKLASVLLDSHPKDHPMMYYVEKAAEEKADPEEVEAEEMFLKNKLDEASGHEVTANEEQSLSDVSSEECEKRVYGDLVNAPSEIKKERKELEDNLTEMKKRLENLAAENSHLRNSLLVKEKLVEDLHKRKSQVESEFEALMSRLDSTEKENAFLRYEFHVLEKELEIRTEEMEYTRRSADLAQKQHLKSVNKIVELEAECQRLRLLVRKKMPGPGVMMPKYKGEFEERRTEARRRKMNPTKDLVVKDELQNKRVSLDILIEQLGNVQEENKNLKEILVKKYVEIKELLSEQKSMELVKTVSPKSYELSPLSSFHIGSEDGVSSCGPLANALVSEMRTEKFKNLQGRTTNGVSEMSLYMDDFVEMEKSAIVSKEAHSRDDESEKSFDWLQVVLNAISKQQRISKRSLQELIEDIRIALGCVNDQDTKKMDEESCPPLCITWTSPGMSPKLGSMTRDEIKKHLGLNKTENQVEKALAGSLHGLKDISPQTENTKHDMKKENIKLKEEIKNMARELEESGEKIRSLETELKNLRESRDVTEDQNETQKSINEDLDTQLTVTRAKLNEVLQKFSSLEVELDYRNSCCEELEGTCLELQLQLESVAKKEPPKYLVNQEGKQSQNDWEMTAASIKLAECQETILNLRRQLKALALPTENKFFSTEPTNMEKSLRRRCSLRDQMLAEEFTEENTNKKESHQEKSTLIASKNDSYNNHNALVLYTPRVYSISKNEDKKDEFASMVVVQSKKQGFGFLKKLLFRGKRGSSKKCLALVKV